MPEPDASADLLRMTSGAQLTQAIYVAAKLGLADLLADGPRSDADLAARAGRTPHRSAACSTSWQAPGCLPSMPRAATA